METMHSLTELLEFCATGEMNATANTTVVPFSQYTLGVKERVKEFRLLWL